MNSIIRSMISGAGNKNIQRDCKIALTAPWFFITSITNACRWGLLGMVVLACVGNLEKLNTNWLRLELMFMAFDLSASPAKSFYGAGLLTSNALFFLSPPPIDKNRLFLGFWLAEEGGGGIIPSADWLPFFEKILLAEDFTPKPEWFFGPRLIAVRGLSGKETKPAFARAISLFGMLPSYIELWCSKIEF